MQNWEDIRREYSSQGLDENSLGECPIKAFTQWFDFAIELKITDANAMCLSTVDREQQVQSRIVLLKDIIDEQFVFYTNYESDKALEMSSNPKVSMCFYWKEVCRQVRINGLVSKINSEKSKEYFFSRPIESQLSVWASKQSFKIANRKELDTKFEHFKEKFSNEIPYPDFWGGYQVKPLYFEFWQGRQSRLHDRVVFKNQKGSWEKYRISP